MPSSVKHGCETKDPDSPVVKLCNSQISETKTKPKTTPNFLTVTKITVQKDDFD